MGPRPAAHARDRDDHGEWKGPPRAVTYLPAFDLEGGGGFAGDAGGWGWLGRVSAGLHRMNAVGVLTLGPEAARERGRYVLGWGAEWVHLRSGLGLDVAALRDLSAERWGYRGALVLSYLRLGVSVYEEDARAYMVSLRVPLALYTAWKAGWL